MGSSILAVAEENNKRNLIDFKGWKEEKFDKIKEYQNRINRFEII